VPAERHNRLASAQGRKEKGKRAGNYSLDFLVGVGTAIKTLQLVNGIWQSFSNDLSAVMTFTRLNQFA
jgi:hypothetical protein